jgi:signal transduction histidine kinase
MNVGAARLVIRLILTQVGVLAVTCLVVVAFAPRLLLLDATVLRGTISGGIWAAALMTLFMVATTWLLTRPVQPMLRLLALGSASIEPVELLTLYTLPARLAVVDVSGALVLSSITLIEALRPETNDLQTQTALVLLTMTMVSAASLPLYVMMRGSVGRVLELAPPEATRDAVSLLEGPGRRVARVRMRLLAAVAGPVAFVALGSSLLVYAHARAQDMEVGEDYARELVSGAMELVSGDGSGRAEAMAQASNHGYQITLAPRPAPGGVAHDEDGYTVVTVPLDAGHARVRFETTHLSPVTGVYVLLSLVATALAGILGARIGKAFADDVALATREIRSTGIQDIVRGTKIPKEARFASISTLMHAIDELGAVFREFASAQERSIEARAATERMRGLFLASMSHDLKGPLNSILGFAELVLRSPLTDAQRESLAIVEQRGRELLTLIHVILDSARAEAGEIDVSPEWTMVGDVVMSAVLEARDLAVGTEVQVVGEIQPGVPKMYVDSGRIVQALTQVIMSAVRLLDKGVVNVRATAPSPQAQRLRIDVETQGRAIPQVELDKIFEAFKYADRARRHGSLGLGLSLARSILEIHGGTIGLEAMEGGGGGGAVFRIWLPTGGDRLSMRSAPSMATRAR